MKFRDDVLSTTDAVVFDNDISYDPTSDYPQVAWSAFVARRGYLTLYSGAERSKNHEAITLLP
ncbi:MAG: hypothetical protein WBG27_13290 [Candidatus Aquilonibacter sp.]